MPSLNLVLTYSKQQYLFSIIKRFNSSAVYSLKHVELIKNITGSSENDVINHLKNTLHIQLLPEEELSYRLNKLLDLQLKDKNVLDKLILVKHHPKTIRHRYLTFKELGVNTDIINSEILSKYMIHIKTSISLLKKKKKILDRETDVVESFLRCTPLGPSNIKLFFSDSNTPDEIKSHIIKQLLIHVVGYTEPFKEENAIMKRIRHKSLAESLRNLAVLQNNVGIPLEKIRNNPFLLSGADPDNTLEIMSTFPSIAGVGITTILNSHPKILATSVHSMIKIHQYLKEAGISEEALSKCFEVFTLNSETVRSRLEECQTNKFLSLCRHHPRVLELIIYQNKAKQRLLKLKESSSIEFLSLNTLASCDKYFDKCIQAGSEKSRGMDSIYFLSKELDCQKEVLRLKLQKHPYWIYTSLLTINRNLQVLLDKGFSKQELIDEICILLYPTEIILMELDKMHLRLESNTCRDANGVLKRSCILPLALYYIEREVNFSGSAIWSRDSSSTEEGVVFRRLNPDLSLERSSNPLAMS